MKSTTDFTSEENFDATEKWQSLCAIYKIPLSKSVTDQLIVLAKKFNLPSSSPVWDQIILTFGNRSRNNVLAQAGLNELNSKVKRPVFSDLTEGTKGLIGKYIAIFAAQDFDANCLHFYGHGVEMSKDPGDLIRNIVGVDNFGPFLSQIINSLGAAHDIIQGLGAPINEKRSAEIFVTESQKMINNLIETYNYSQHTIAILEKYRDYTIPFLAEECIVNGTFLLFNSGKRDFDNILTQVNHVFEQAHGGPFESMKLSKDIVAMKLAMALSDTRRSEIKAVLRKLESLHAVIEDKKNIPVLVKLLRSAGLLKNDEELPDLSSRDKYVLEKLMKIEGFLLRLGPNIRMTSELAYAKDPQRKQSINDLRVGKPVDIKVKSHLEPFLNSIEGPFGETAFAKALGEINNFELNEIVNYHQLELMINPDTFDYKGWERHAENLMTMKKNIEKMPNDEKREIAKLIYFMAAKSPGHKVGQDIYDAMKNYRSELALSPNPKSLTHLDANIAEIAAADPGLDRKLASGYTSPAHARSSSYTRGRFYSAPNISITSQSSPRKKLSPESSKSPTTTIRKFEFISPPATRKGSLDKTTSHLPSIHQKSKPTSKENTPPGADQSDAVTSFLKKKNKITNTPVLPPINQTKKFKK